MTYITEPTHTLVEETCLEYQTCLAEYQRGLENMERAARAYFSAVVDQLAQDALEAVCQDDGRRPALDVVRDSILLRDIDMGHALAVLTACGERPTGDAESIFDRAKDLRLEAVLSRLCVLAADQG